MNLLDFYKKSIYEHGYFMCNRDIRYKTDHRDVTNDVYFNDEMDFYICNEYYSRNYSYGEDWSNEDKKFLEVLGFVPEDFDEYEG